MTISLYKKLLIVLAALVVAKILLFDPILDKYKLKNDTRTEIKNSETLSGDSNGQIKYDFKRKYPDATKCHLEGYDKECDNLPDFVVNVNNEFYSTPATARLQEMPIVRGMIFYFPVKKFMEFRYEFRWLYRSWVEMIKSEPSKWRTDLLVFLTDHPMIKRVDVFKQLNCSFKNKRRSSLDLPMCSLINYVPISERNISKDQLNPDKLMDQFIHFDKEIFNYQYLLNEVNIFPSKEVKNDEPFDKAQTIFNTASTLNTGQPEIAKNVDFKFFYYFLKNTLSSYSYVDSILIAFDGYDYFKEGGYNFLIRSDMDVFLTPLFAKWTPKKCNDFIVGNGAYSDEFNFKRLKRAAKELGFQFADMWNLGSTWYSTPEQFRLVSYLTLFSMGYLSEEEFTVVEREGKLGVIMWPYWHYGVLLLYGQNLAMNHVIGSRHINIVKLDQLLDVTSTELKNIDKVLHIHVYHHDDMFSKFQFKAGAYDNMTYNQNPKVIRMYSLKMAMEGKFMRLEDLNQMLKNVSHSKN